MSAAEHVMDSERGDSSRFLKAFVLAVIGHVILFLVFAIVQLAERPSNLAPVSVELVPGTLSEPAPAGPPGPAAAQPQSPAQSQAQPQVRQSTGGEQGFVIPTPRQSPEAAAMPRGPAFRTEGAGSAPASSAPQATSPVQEPVFPHVTKTQQGTAPAPGGAVAQTSGPAHGVLVEGGGQGPVKGSLNLGSVDTFANAQGSGAPPNGESAAGGGGGGGGGGGTGVSPGGSGQGGGIRWDQPEAAKARKLLSSAQPEIPAWVSKQGLNLNVLVYFTLTPDGFLRDVNVEASSGFNDVDAAVMEAVRRWRFTPDPSARNIRGMIPYVIRAR